jgi:hypothetical protein
MAYSMKTTNDWVAIEREHGNMVALHIITMAGVSMPTGYVQLTSWESFRNKQLEAKFGENKRKRPTRWFTGYRFEEWQAEQDRTTASMVRCGITDWVPEHERGVPVLRYKDLWSFYETVGWDKKKGRLV